MKRTLRRKHVQLYREVTWQQFGIAWTDAPPKEQSKKLNILRLWGVLVMW